MPQDYKSQADQHKKYRYSGLLVGTKNWQLEPLILCTPSLHGYSRLGNLGLTHPFVSQYEPRDRTGETGERVVWHTTVEPECLESSAYLVRRSLSFPGRAPLPKFCRNMLCCLPILLTTDAYNLVTDRVRTQPCRSSYPSSLQPTFRDKDQALSPHRHRLLLGSWDQQLPIRSAALWLGTLIPPEC
jgi:hypothetical protein